MMKINACSQVRLTDKVPLSKCVLWCAFLLSNLCSLVYPRANTHTQWKPTFLQTIYLYLAFHRCIRYYKGRHWINLSESASNDDLVHNMFKRISLNTQIFLSKTCEWQMLIICSWNFILVNNMFPQCFSKILMPYGKLTHWREVNSTLHIVALMNRVCLSNIQCKWKFNTYFNHKYSVHCTPHFVTLENSIQFIEFQ